MSARPKTIAELELVNVRYCEAIARQNLEDHNEQLERRNAQLLRERVELVRTIEQLEMALESAGLIARTGLGIAHEIVRDAGRPPANPLN